MSESSLQEVRRNSEVPPIFGSSRGSVSAQKLLFACKVVALLGFIISSCMGYGGKVSGQLVLGGMIGSLTVYVISSLLMGHHRLRRVELVAEVVQLFILVGIAAIKLKSIPARTLALGTLPILLLSTIPMTLQLYQAHARYKMRKELSENRECRQIALGRLTEEGPIQCETSAFLVHNPESRLKPEEVAKSGENFSVITFNTAFMRKIISTYSGHMRSPVERAQQIADYLLRMSPEELPTHFCLQECFSEEAATILTKALSQLYQTVVCDIAPHPGFGEGSGLIFATRWQGLEKVQFGSCYCEPLSEETLVDKGIAVFTFRDAAGQEIRVGNLHLVSRASMERRKQEFDKQLVPILRSFQKGPFIIAGDYNMPPSNREHGVSFPEDLGIMCAKHRHKRSTFFNNKHPQWGENTHVTGVHPMTSGEDFMDKRGKGAIFDHIGATEEHFSIVEKAETICLYDFANDPTPSDHLAVKVAFKRK
jgi:hypothetical protein